MFGLDWSELLIIAVVGIMVIGPKELPKALRGLGRITRQLQTMAGEFRKQFDEAIKEAELDDVKKTIADVKKLDPTAEIRKSVNDSFSPMSAVTKSFADTKSAIQSSITIAPPAAGTTAAAVAATVAPSMAAANDTVAPVSAVAEDSVNGAATADASIDHAKRGVAQRAADAWKKAAGSDA